MVRTQVQFTEEQLTRLRAAAERSQRSVAEVVRESVDTYLSSHDDDRRDAMKRTLAIMGKFSSGLTDVSVRHDDYFADSILES